MEPSGEARGYGEGGFRRRMSLLLATFAVGATCFLLPSLAAADPGLNQGNANGHETAPGQQPGHQQDDAGASASPVEQPVIPPVVDEPTGALVDDPAVAVADPIGVPAEQQVAPVDASAVGALGESQPAVGEASPAPVDQSVNVDQTAVAAAEAQQIGTATGAGTGNGSAKDNDKSNGNGNGNGNGNANNNSQTNNPVSATEIQNGSTSETTVKTNNGNQNENVSGNANGNGNGNSYGHGNGNGNAHVTVRIDEPGDSGSIHQQNDATAAATATVEADVASAGPVDTTQTAVAEAGASQIDVGNAVVTVRVGSGGDDGPVTQVNAAVAEAAAEATASLPTTETVVEALAQATQESVSNTTVSVRVFSPGDDGPISQVNEAAASASAVGGNELAAASATQDDVRNTNVAIRVESPGTSAPVEQRSQAIETVEAAPSPTSSLTSAAPRAESVTATEEEPTAPRPAVSVTTVANDTAVAVNVVGDQLGRPGIGSEDELVVWEWVWTWDRAEETDEIVATTDASSWTWDWSVGDAPGGKVTTRTATEAEQAGTWTWAWDWDREVPDWAWTWIWSTSLMCDSCAWVWDWDWSWTGEPSGVVGTDDGLSATDRVGGSDLPISADVVQRNGAVAESVASVVADVTQTSQQVEPIAGESFIGQLTDVVQTASAMTSSTQELGPALATDAASEAVVTTTANAELVAVVAQSAQQDAVVAPEASVSQWIGQQAGVVQDSSAIATGAQGGVDTGSVSAAATSQGISLVVQDATQEALVDGGMATQWVGQLTLVDQVLDSASVTAQTGAADAIGVGSRSGAPTAVSVAVASDLSHVAQSAMQHASRANGVGEQTVSQIVVVEQVASSSAATAQSVGGSSSVTAAGSHAVAINRSLVEQLVEQAQFGLTPIEIQDSEQQVLVEQFAVATSTSAGSAGGPALVVNCSTVQQGAAQWIGVSRSALGLGDATSFCAPPSAAERRAFSGPPPSPDQATAVTPVAIDEAPVEGDLPPLHGSRFIPSADVAPSGKTRGAMAPFAPPVAPSFGTPSPQQLSAPPTPQARFDTRPGGSAGTEDTGREPLLPPVGGSPGWAAALAAAASAAGSSGIAAILFALALVPPLGLRVRNGSVVRRPASVLSWVDVPI